MNKELELMQIVVTIFAWIVYRSLITIYSDRIIELYQMYRPKWLTRCTTCFMYNLGALEVVLMIVFWWAVNVLLN